MPTGTAIPMYPPDCTHAYTFTTVLRDGRQSQAGPFLTWQRARLHITRQVADHGEHLHAIGMVETMAHRGRLLDFSASHYSRAECFEIAGVQHAAKVPS